MPAAQASTRPEHEALARAVEALMRPLAALAVARGLPYAVVEAELKRAFVAAALAAHPGVPPHRAVSRVSTATGLGRREVTKLLEDRASPAVAKGRSVAAQVFTRWLSDGQWCTPKGRPRILPRQGVAPSFEALAQSVTRDVHPRSVLDELCRLGLAELDAQDRVHLLSERFVPNRDRARMLAFLGDNVGDHLAAAVDNVLGEAADAPRHFEQALFADELSTDALRAARDMVREHWQSLLSQASPALEQLMDADREAGRAQDHRLRIGLYTYAEPMVGASAPHEPTTPRRPPIPATPTLIPKPTPSTPTGPAKAKRPRQPKES